jgi:adenylate cyclase
MMRLAEDSHDTALLLEARRVLGIELTCRGHFAPGVAQLEQSIALYEPQQHRSHAYHYGIDTKVFCAAIAGIAMLLLGFPDKALEYSREALTYSRTLSHPYSLAFAMRWAGLLHIFRREANETRELAEASIAHATEWSLGIWLSLGTIWRGWALTEDGQLEAGIADMRQGLAEFQATGSKFVLPYMIGLHASALREMGKGDESVRLVDDALEMVDETGERFCEAELHRLKGVVLMGQFTPDPRVAEISFLRALEIARTQSAKFWELRAATSLARLWHSQGKTTEARGLLAPVYGWFTEGFDTADLKEAKSLLDELNA